jgi:hypothetical protein
MEVELLLSAQTKDDNPIHCIRLNPTDYTIGGNNSIGIGLGAKEALESITQHLYPLTSKSET